MPAHEPVLCVPVREYVLPIAQAVGGARSANVRFRGRYLDATFGQRNPCEEAGKQSTRDFELRVRGASWAEAVLHEVA